MDSRLPLGGCKEPCCPAFAPDRVKSSGLASTSIGLHLTGQVATFQGIRPFACVIAEFRGSAW